MAWPMASNTYADKKQQDVFRAVFDRVKSNQALTSILVLLQFGIGRVVSLLHCQVILANKNRTTRHLHACVFLFPFSFCFVLLCVFFPFLYTFFFSTNLMVC